MNDNAKKWVAALRSGKFRQGRGRLAKRDKSKHIQYCCLGVACRVYEQETGKTISMNGTRCGDEVKFFDGEADLLPSSVADWLNIKDSSGDFGTTSLMSLNDKSKLSFKEIADEIERHEKDLFCN